mmetsp:Transcript_11912/g.42939  ORF Transcript_11912/g.42939 Transcript_11912/m.42939 type:complete len:220 (+) Transcript_11912:1015-1674(+)
MNSRHESSIRSFQSSLTSTVARRGRAAYLLTALHALRPVGFTSFDASRLAFSLSSISESLSVSTSSATLKRSTRSAAPPPSAARSACVIGSVLVNDATSTPFSSKLFASPRSTSTSSPPFPLFFFAASLAATASFRIALDLTGTKSSSAPETSSVTGPAPEPGARSRLSITGPGPAPRIGETLFPPRELRRRMSRSRLPSAIVSICASICSMTSRRDAS